MQFKDVIGHAEIKRKLIQTIKDKRVSHAQLVLGPEGTHKVALAIAYAQFINCENPAEKDSCGVCPSCVKYQKLQHPDLHLIFPTVTTPNNLKPSSEDYILQFIEFLKKTDFHISLSDWIEFAWEEKKQGVITAKDANRIIELINMKNYEAPVKVFIIWMVEKLNHLAAPKLLKTIEEPPDNSLIIMVTENYDKILNTILSRSQLIKLSKYPNDIIRNELINKYQVPVTKAANIARFVDGNFYAALKESKEDRDFDYTTEYIEFMRSTFAVVKKRAGLEKLEAWISKIGKQSRENQIAFLKYCLSMTRQCMLNNLNEESLLNINDEEADFMSKFSPFINESNVTDISDEFNKAILHVERNGNANLIFYDLSFKIGALLRKLG